jgi:hypothetical protein
VIFHQAAEHWQHYGYRQMRRLRPQSPGYLDLLRLYDQVDLFATLRAKIAEQGAYPLRVGF